MPIITLTIDKPAATQSIEVSDADFARIAAKAIADRAGCIIETPAIEAVPAEVDEKGEIITPAIEAEPAVRRDPTATEAIILKADDFFMTLIGEAEAHDRANAAKAAADQVVPIAVKR